MVQIEKSYNSNKMSEDRAITKANCEIDLFTNDFIILDIKMQDFDWCV